MTSHDGHPHAPGPPDPHTELCVFRFADRTHVLVGLWPKERQPKKWYAARVHTRRLSLDDSQTPYPIVSLARRAAKEEPKRFLRWRWFAMLTPEQARRVLEIGEEP